MGVALAFIYIVDTIIITIIRITVQDSIKHNL